MLAIISDDSWALSDCTSFSQEATNNTMNAKKEKLNWRFMKKKILRALKRKHASYKSHKMRINIGKSQKLRQPPFDLRVFLIRLK